MHVRCSPGMPFTYDGNAPPMAGHGPFVWAFHRMEIYGDELGKVMQSWGGGDWLLFAGV